MDHPPPPPNRAAPGVPAPERPPPLPRRIQDTEHEQFVGKFRRVLSTKRMNRLSRSASPAPRDFVNLAMPHGMPPSYSSLRNLPIIPTPATEPKAVRFRNLMHMLSNTPLNWENPGLLDEALRSVPLERIYAQAEEHRQINAAEAASLGLDKPAWAYQDCVILSLLDWFRKSFFTWINNPPCARCGSPTISVGRTPPQDEEKARGATNVELYQCSLPECAIYERFPRYSDAFVLMQTRKGRVGEWACCFGMLCRAMGLRVRWVWNSEDHVWIEYFSQHANRWVHIDPVEGWFDKPLSYTTGWGRQLGYCIAFSRDGATDVTRRYVRNLNHWSKERVRCSEANLLYILDEIRAMRRKDMAKSEKFKLKGEDLREEYELSTIVAKNLVLELCRNLNNPQTQSRVDIDALKVAEARQEGMLLNQSKEFS
jgi:peptide-N4-(N-acetyl-beta-glucosaminyl)asparagine amidase